MITKEFVQSVRGRLESNPAISTADIARELGAREVDVITSMPVPMRKRLALKIFLPFGMNSKPSPQCRRSLSVKMIWGTFGSWLILQGMRPQDRFAFLISKGGILYPCP